jgi:hypothetical protein
LSETGLYAGIATRELSTGVLPYTPQFPLWSDGTEKQRWILLPNGAQIDTSNMDEWKFPEGTRVWKQFSVGGVRIETRLLENVTVAGAVSYSGSPRSNSPASHLWAEVDLGGLIQQGRLSDPPTSGPVVPGNSVEVGALGYFHGNCSHCHNQTRPERRGARCFDAEAAMTSRSRSDNSTGSHRRPRIARWSVTP